MAPSTLAVPCGAWQWALGGSSNDWRCLVLQHRGVSVGEPVPTQLQGPALRCPHPRAGGSRPPHPRTGAGPQEHSPGLWLGASPWLLAPGGGEPVPAIPRASQVTEPVPQPQWGGGCWGGSPGPGGVLGSSAGGWWGRSGVGGGMDGWRDGASLVPGMGARLDERGELWVPGRDRQMDRWGYSGCSGLGLWWYAEYQGWMQGAPPVHGWGGWGDAGDGWGAPGYR